MSKLDPVPITIDVFSDVMCPWCLIGFGQLSKALASLEGEIDAEVIWRPYELNPDMPQEGEQQAKYLQRKYGRSERQGAELHEQMKYLANEAGVSLSYAGEDDPPSAMMWNTRAAHKILMWALETAGAKAQTKLKLAFFNLHFNQRKNISDPMVLIDAAEKVGFDRTMAHDALMDSALTDRVIAEEEKAWDLNISGVPAMIINDNFMIPGAQSAETYVNVLRRLAMKLQDG